MYYCGSLKQFVGRLTIPGEVGFMNSVKADKYKPGFTATEHMHRRSLLTSVFLMLQVYSVLECGVVRSQILTSRPGVTVADLQSPDPLRRARAFGTWQDNPSLLEPTKSASILLDLLDRENRLFDTTLLESNGREGAGEKYGEGWAEYYKELLETVERTANKKDPRVVEIIAGGTFSPGWDAAVQLAAQYTDRILPVILAKSRSSLSFRRGQGIEMLAVIALHAPSLANDKKTVIRDALSARITMDPEPALRGQAVRALGKIGDSRDLALLRHVAQTDPEVLVNQGKQTHPIRDWAADAVKQIEDRSKN
jgi:HEAT repeats